MTSTEWRHYRHQGTGYFDRWTSWLTVLAHRLLRWQALSRERRHLRSLDDRMLKDMGLGRTAVEREAARPFWDMDGMELKRFDRLG